jgi:hypothetical protein
VQRAGHRQPSGSPWFDGAVASIGAVVALLSATSGCARGVSELAPSDAADNRPDSAHVSDARPDAPHVSDARPDARPDAGCAIAVGLTVALDGNGDLAKYTAAQQLSLGAMMGSDAAAIAWDRDHLYITMSSTAFGSAYEPLHVYVETGTDLGAAVPAPGKEYGGLVPALPFTPTHLIGIRRVTDSGTGGPYDGVYAAAGWTQATSLTALVSTDQQTLSTIVPWSALGGCPTTLRLAVHVVNGVVANEWKDLVPASHTPWQSPGGNYYQIDLTGSTAVSSWALH